VKLYTFDPAPNPRRVGLFAAYKGIDLPIQQIDLRTGEQFSVAFRAINPQCTVPALQLDDGQVLCGALAICWFLECRFPNRPLFGTDPLVQAQVLSWDSYLYTEGLAAVAEALRNRSEAFKDRALPGPHPVPQIPELERRGRQRLQPFWERLDDHLRGRAHVVGDTMTLADIDLLVVIDFASWIKEHIPDSRPSLTAWYERTRETFPKP